MKLLAWVGMIFIFAACSVPEVATPAPTQVAIHIVYASALRAWADELTNCADRNPHVALYFTQIPGQKADMFFDEITLQLGEQAINDRGSYLSQVGSDQIVVVVNSSNTIDELTTDQLRSIFSGQITKWENGESNLIQVWGLPPADPVNIIFTRVLTQELGITSNAMLAADSQAMLEAVASDQSAIGFVPESIFSTADPSIAAKVKRINLDDQLEKALTQPVIAITKGEPDGLTRELLVCLEALNP